MCQSRTSRRAGGNWAFPTINDLHVWNSPVFHSCSWQLFRVSAGISMQELVQKKAGKGVTGISPVLMEIPLSHLSWKIWGFRRTWKNPGQFHANSHSCPRLTCFLRAHWQQQRPQSADADRPESSGTFIHSTFIVNLGENLSNFIQTTLTLPNAGFHNRYWIFRKHSDMIYLQDRKGKNHY